MPPGVDTNGAEKMVHVSPKVSSNGTGVDGDVVKDSSPSDRVGPSGVSEGSRDTGETSAAHNPSKLQSISLGRHLLGGSPRKAAMSENTLEMDRPDDEEADLDEAMRIINESRTEQEDAGSGSFTLAASVSDEDDSSVARRKDDSVLLDLHEDGLRPSGDVTNIQEEPPIAGRRPRRAAQKALEAARNALSEEEGSSSDDAEIESGSESEISSEGASETSDEDFSDEEETSPKRTPQRKKRRVDVDSDSDAPMAAPDLSVRLESKRKVGRPAKKGMEQKIKSIFELDDEMLEVEKSPSKKVRLASPAAKANSDIWSEFQQQDQKEIENEGPTLISGIPEKEPPKAPAKKFVPFPEPKMTANGKVDPDYLRRYLPDVDFEARGADLMDDRSFFMEGTEGYFEQHSMRPKLGRSSLALLAPNVDYSEFAMYNRLPQLLQKDSIEKLATMHKWMYHQWCVELSEGYSINFYGVGSKRQLILDYVQEFLLEWIAGHYHLEEEETDAIVVNGYHPNTQLKQAVYDIQAILVPKDVQRKLKFSKHIFETIPMMLKYLASVRDDQRVAPRVVLVVHNVDGPGLLDEKTQSLLSQLVLVPEIWLISSTDNFNASLLWDLAKLKNFNFVWHDLTSFQPYTVELLFKDLLNTGKSAKFVGTRGAKWVLSSLTANARNLYRTLLQLQIENLNKNAASEAAKANLKGNLRLAVGFKQLYDACSDQFITSNEISFRTMLGEYVEHKMCNLKKKPLGGEAVFVPFSYDEMKKLLAEEFDVFV